MALNILAAAYLDVNSTDSLWCLWLTLLVVAYMSARTTFCFLVTLLIVFLPDTTGRLFFGVGAATTTLTTKLANQCTAPARIQRRIESLVSNNGCLPIIHDHSRSDVQLSVSHLYMVLSL